MDSSTLSILCVEFSRLPVESQNQEIGNLSTLAGGIQINRNSDESEEGFRRRTFEEGLKTITNGSEYKISFFKNKIIPSLIEDFKDASVDAQERLLEKLTELTDGALTERKSGESEHGFRVRIYSQLLRKIPAGYEFEMVEFARQIGESKDENQYDQEDKSDDESSAARSDHGYFRGSEIYCTKGGSILYDGRLESPKQNCLLHEESNYDELNYLEEESSVSRPIIMHCDLDELNYLEEESSVSRLIIMHCDLDELNYLEEESSVSRPIIMHCDLDELNYLEEESSVSRPIIMHCDPVQRGAWNDGGKVAGFNPKLKLKVKSKTTASPTSNS